MTPQDKESFPEKVSHAEKVLFFFKDVAFSSASARTASGLPDPPYDKSTSIR
ncbi:hypothetical protein ACFQ3N_09405 [Virgibacillus byunsanensis]|uniref:Uncharacterized protein n=1 Tax=Virgibacillus byunsanensis TaxID=570945 RepID=A0ABW3LKP2_9BACI